jgi:hypothetical protein
VDDQNEVSYKEAEQEWEEILAAMEIFAHALGRDFQPLPADVTLPIATPHAYHRRHLGILLCCATFIEPASPLHASGYYDGSRGGSTNDS